MDEVVAEFLTESAEGLDLIDRDLIELEKHPESAEIIKQVFRTMHTIKGTCGFLGFSTLESVAHAAENLLVALRNGTLPVREEIVSAILAAIDAVRFQLAGIAQTGTDPENDYSELLARLEGLQRPQAQASSDSSHSSDSEEQIHTAPATAGDPQSPPPRKVGEILLDAKVVTPDELTLALHEQALGSGRLIGEILVDHGVAAQATIEKVVDADHETRRAGATESTIRVEVGVLDSLMNLIGELVLTRNQIVKMAGSSANRQFMGPSRRLSELTADLQAEVMRARMQPIGNAWAKIPRIVRDLAKACGKNVVVETEGADAELDKTILEAIKDPLTHLVRNAVDHGIESPEVRLAAGKPAEGKLFMRAYHESGTVIIEIADDGGGIDVAKIRTKVVKNGIMTFDEAEHSTDREILNCIFLAGFSTAETTTTVSGRGVGMDVVRSKIESIRGNVDLKTEVGVGTTFIIRIPLTLAIVPALMIRDGGEYYAIEQSSLVELVRLDKNSVGNGIEFVHSTPVYRLRDRLLELIPLGQLLGRQTTPLIDRPSIDIVVVKVDSREFGLVVDETEDTEDVVVKPLGQHFAHVPAYIGATIRADGGLAVILDVRALSEMAGARSELRSALQEQASETTVLDLDSTALLVRVGSVQVALPIDAVVRLEEFPADTIEVLRGEWRVQNRGELLRLVDGGALNVGSQSDFSMGNHNGFAHVVVCGSVEQPFGFIVDEIMDIVSANTSADVNEAIVRGVTTAIVSQHTLAMSS